jgi:hypothetical protein
MADLILLPTLERLHPYNAFGLTFSVALSDTGGKRLKELGDLEGPSRSFLKPWSWKSGGKYFLDIQKVMFFSLDGTSLPCPLNPPKNLLTDSQRRALEDALEKRFKLFEEMDAEDFSPWSHDLKTATAVSKDRRPWPAFLAQFSLYPFPLPQGLRLSSSLSLKLTKEMGSQIVAAPVLRFRRDGAVIDLIPELEQDSKAPVVLKYIWPKPPAPAPAPATPTPSGGAAPPTPPAPPAKAPFEFPILARTMPCSTDNPLNTTYFDFKHLWVKIDGTSITGTDWRAGLELRLAEQLHIPRTVLEWMKDEKKDKPKEEIRPELVASYPKMAWFALQRLQDVLGPGLRKGPDGSFLRRVSAFPNFEPPKDLDGFANGARKWFAGQPWMGWLRQAVTGVPLEKDVTGARLLDAAVSADPEAAIGRLLTLDQTVNDLDQVLASVATPATLRALFKLQWKAYVEGNSGAPALARALAGDLPKEIELQRLLMLDHLGLYWEDLQEAFTGSPSLPDARTGLKASYVEILKSLKAPLWNKQDLESLGAKFIGRVLPEKIELLEESGTRGLTFQLDTLGHDEGSTDALPHMQGVAMLMRRKSDPNPEWHCLNLAAAQIGSTPIDPVLIPSKIVYQNGLRSPTVTYDNAPLTVAGPLGLASAIGAELSDPRGQHKKPIDEPLIALTHSAIGKLPGLVFDEIYEIQPFLVTNSGAIPRPLSNGNPWRLKTPIPGDLKAPTPVPRHYLREAHVGSLRFLSDESSGLPPIPANVAPQTRELAPEIVLPDNDPILLGKPDTGFAGTPLLLLAPSTFSMRPGVQLRKSFKFKILPPTVDLQTWDRWVAKDKKLSKERRKFVWRSFHQLAHNNGSAKRKLEDAGAYLDDPAIEAIWVELAGLRATGKYTVLDSKRLTLVKKAEKPDFTDWKSARCSLGTEQNRAIEVECSLDASGLKVTLGSSDDQHVQTTFGSLVGSGGLFRLSFYASMKPEDEKRFSQGKENVRAEGTSPWHLLIEVPQQLPSSQPELRDALLRALTPKPEGDKLTVGLDLNRSDLEGLQGAVYRAELLHQVWSWRGRPPAPVPAPYPAPLDQDPNRRFFEMAEFGERADDEHRRLPMPRLADPAPRQPVFRYEENLAEQGPRGDLRSLYHRFSVRVFSRWEGILREAESYLDAKDMATQVLWQPLLVPCRHTGNVPVPKVKLVLPLTQGISEKVTDGPGLMVVTDGAWYEMGGLAEELGVEVMEVTAPDQKTQYLQAGTDPIVTGQSAGDQLGEPEGALRAPVYKIEFAPEGAIGHHRDNSQTSPHFLASSFLLPRPVVCHKEDAGKDKILPADLAWWFLKLRFRRELRLPGRVNVSEWSPPFWVQFLPGIERVEAEWFGGGDLEVLLNGGQLTVKGKPVPGAHEKFHLFGVMTRKVIDFAGRPDQEAYLGVWRPQGGSWVTDIKKVPEPATDLYIRWIEVQSPRLPAIDSGDALWKTIFDPNQNDAERARIVRISKRFCINSRSCS